MIIHRSVLILIHLVCSVSAATAAEKLAAFPGADGFGAFTQGGRGGA